MPIVRLIEGPVGAGKSTFAAAMAARSGGVHIALDAWFARLFSPDRPAGDFISWYVERKERLLALIWAHSHAVLASGVDVILELGLIQRQTRRAFCRQVLDAGIELVMYELDAPRDLRRARVQRRNVEQGATFSMVVPDPIFELASDLWEPADEWERDEYAVERICTASGALRQG
ncbi:ATP-binding protein [Mitsuaria sp. WAJ17]|uniref:AAA family ATPase n=1 Tax=Mitsuaria sp. WAJ17 TaxID=2761452 RepID=UPI001601ACDB|nr:ATP-binding protein [Mitsuaria sp. WAJ17]MBB2485806.1 ATP-binding protein [Mitsuaria sp. WAJ17]